jgi:hypothetical protein
MEGPLKKRNVSFADELRAIKIRHLEEMTRLAEMAEAKLKENPPPSVVDCLERFKTAVRDAVINTVKADPTHVVEVNLRVSIATSTVQIEYPSGWSNLICPAKHLDIWLYSVSDPESSYIRKAIEPQRMHIISLAMSALREALSDGTRLQDQPISSENWRYFKLTWDN